MLIIIVRTAWKYDKKIISDLEIKKENGTEKKLLKNLKYSKDMEERRICKCFFKLSNFFKSVN